MEAGEGDEEEGGESTEVCWRSRGGEGRLGRGAEDGVGDGGGEEGDGGEPAEVKCQRVLRSRRVERVGMEKPGATEQRRTQAALLSSAEQHLPSFSQRGRPET